MRKLTTKTQSDVLAIIPARAGSKGVPGKNKRMFCGKPLIYWTIDTALKSKAIDKIVVTTDDVDILKDQYIKENVDFVIERPKSISGDSANANEYILHVLDTLERALVVKHICILQPTSPLRLSSDIDELYSNVKSSNLECGVTVVDVPHNFSPQSLMIEKLDYIEKCDLTSEVTLRQNKEQFIARNGAAVYICKVNHFRKHTSIFDKKMASYKMPMLRSIDIDTQEDFILAELIMKERLCVE